MTQGEAFINPGPMTTTSRAVYLIVFDSVGIGAAPDAAEYGDCGANTLGHIATTCDGLNLPVMQRWGLGNIPALLPEKLPIKGVPPTDSPAAAFGALQEMSQGKDTTTGHWELAGLLLENGFQVFPAKFPSFPADLLDPFINATGRGILGNCAASGTKIISDLGPEHISSGKWIVYTSADSVLQIAAHEETVPLEELYRACETAREIGNRYRIGRIIARPFTGKPGAFKRTVNRRDFSYPLPEDTLLDKIKTAGMHVTTIGKLDDIFNQRGITSAIHLETSDEAITATLQLAKKNETHGLIFVNLIDFDMLYGHRRDPDGYAEALQQADSFLGNLEQFIRPGDLIIVTADHGNDPTFEGSDHTREYVPLLVYGLPQPRPLGIRYGFFDVAQSIAAALGIQPMSHGKSFL